MNVRWMLALVVAVRALSSVSCDFELLLLHTNDMHGQFGPTDVDSQPLTLASTEVTKRNYGGFARVKYAVNQAKARAALEGVPSLFLNAGDTFLGSPLYTLHKHKIVADLMNMMDINAMTLGNHEFDEGPSGLRQFLNMVNINVIVSNLDFSEEPELYNITKLRKSLVINLKGRKIGIVGYLAPDTQARSFTGKVRFDDEVQRVKWEARKLKNNGVKIIIALGHSGLSIDQRVAAEVPDISLVIGAHSHSFLYTPPDKPPSTEVPVGPYPLMVSQQGGKKVVPVVTAYAFTKYLGILWAKFDEDGNFISARPESNPLLLDDTIPMDIKIQEKVNKWKRGSREKFTEIIGRTGVPLEGKSSVCRIRECNFGNLITDSFVDYVAERHTGLHGWTDAAVALIQGGLIRSALKTEDPDGNVTYEDVLISLLYNDELYKIQVPGRTLRVALEHSVSNHSYSYPYAASFLQVSGVHVTYDMNKPPYERIVKADIRCANCSIPVYSPLNDDEVYTIITIAFLVHGGDEFSMLKNASHREIILADDGVNVLTDTAAVTTFIKKHKVIFPEISGRITILYQQPVETNSLGSLARNHLALTSVLLILFKFF